MGANAIVHVIGTGTIGEPLIGLLCMLKDQLGIEEITFHKRTPLLTDRSKVVSLMRKGAKLCVDDSAAKGFQDLGMEPSYEAVEAISRAGVVIDCTPSGVGTQNKTEYYEKFTSNTLGFIAQGSEFGFGKPYARGINDETLVAGEDRFVQIVSCNTHNMATLLKTLCSDEEGHYCLDNGNFVCIRRANDISQAAKFLPSPQVGRHDDSEFGTHHARDAHELFTTLDKDLDVFSSALKVNTQYMHSIWFRLARTEPITLDSVVERLRSNPRVAVTNKGDANLIFSFGRDHGYYGRILSQTVVVVPTLTVRRQREIYGFCFTPQDGNSLLSSIAAALWHIDPRWETVRERLSPIRRWLYREI